MRYSNYARLFVRPLL